MHLSSLIRTWCRLYWNHTYFMNARHDIAYFWLSVEFFVLKWSVHPQLRAFYFLSASNEILHVWKVLCFLVSAGCLAPCVMCCGQACLCLVRYHRRKNRKTLRFDNPVYRAKGEEDQFTLHMARHQSVSSLPPFVSVTPFWLFCSYTTGGIVFIVN